MPFLEVNGARLYFETFGKETPGKAPIVLIHGSTGTGRSNWSQVAPLLARDYFVIVPDCRGHGKSSNPKHTYTFKEMAADTAALVRALGYQRAHIIGHSNGGNVALVVLLEHPEVVLTAIPQAANAWVSPDLVEREPALFDPDHVQSASPEWMGEMIALHSETHGQDYWRELLRLTVEELIREPNYTPADLAKVKRPTLVIQGEKDGVNAAYKHAEFIAKFIPDAELWVPQGIGHTVHGELLFPWVEKVLDFLKRRGDDENEALYRLGRACYSDKRDWIYSIRASGSQEHVKLGGQVLLDEQRQAAVKLFDGRAVEEDIQVLIKPETSWALVDRYVTDLREKPGRLTQRISQVLLGEAVRILEDQGEWVRVRCEHDGYLGWVQAEALFKCDETRAYRYAADCTDLVLAETVPARVSPVAPEAVTKLGFGPAIEVVDHQAGLSAIQFPGGRCVWIPQEALLPLAERPHPDAAGVQQTLKFIRRFAGVPYLWGGRSPFGYDCSGLAQAFLRFMSLRPKRDASQQFKEGSPVEGELLPGDLLFFGEPDLSMQLPGETESAPRPISHVAISLGGNDLIHATGSSGQVTFNSLDPASRLYSAWIRENLVGSRRFV